MFVRILILVGVAVLVWSAVARSSQAHGAKQVVTVSRTTRSGRSRSATTAATSRDAIWRIEQANHLPGADVRVGERLVLP